MTSLKEHWRTSLLFRRVVAASGFVLAALLVYFGSHIPRSVSLPEDDLNAKSIARVGESQIILQRPDIAEGDLALSYVGNKNEVADIWLENATLDDRSQRLLFPNSTVLSASRISYTTGASAGRTKSDDTCHTTIEIRRAKGSVPIEALKLYQTDTTAGPQRFRQVVLDAGKTPVELEVHTDSPTPGAMDLPGCHKLLTVGGNKPVDLPPIPVLMLVQGGKIDLRFSPANPAVPIFTDNEHQAFEAASLGDGALQGNGLQILSVRRSKAQPELDVRATRSGDGITLSHMKLGSETLQLDIGRDPEKARAYANGTSLYNYDLVAAIQKNPVLSFAFAVVLVPALWKWVKKNCFPGMSE